VLACLQKFGVESPHTRIELIETILGHRTDVLSSGQAQLAIFSGVPPGLLGDPLLRVRFAMVAAPGHPLHELGRKLTQRDLRQHRYFVIRETNPDRGQPVSMDAIQRWTVSDIATAAEAARAGYGFAFLPQDVIRADLDAGLLKELPMRDGADRFAELYLIFADSEHAGPGTLRLAEIIREQVRAECRRAAPTA
jgi:DNA-binding transcriptional LysR family regulator